MAVAGPNLVDEATFLRVANLVLQATGRPGWHKKNRSGQAVGDLSDGSFI